MVFNFRKDITPNSKNYLTQNPINKNDVKRKKINGEYIYERFYIIDFKDIKENSYVISSFGRIFSLITNKEIKGRTVKTKNNYRSISLIRRDGSEASYTISRLVARAFIPKTTSDKKMNRLFIHHKNWDNEYNYYWNLEWRSASEIALLNTLKKDSEEIDIVKIVCKFLENDESIVDIFDMIDGRISKEKISRIKNKKIYTEVSCNYKF